MATLPIQPKPQLEDPLHEREIFATEIVGLSAIHGNVVITLATARMDEAPGNAPPNTRRIVAGRLVLTNVAAAQLLQGLQTLVVQLESRAATEKKGASPS